MPEVSKHINETLTKGILKSYKAGIKAVVDKNKSSILQTGEEPAFNKYDDEKFNPENEIDVITGKKSKLSSIFNVDYTAVDLKAIKNFRVEAFTVATIGEYELEEKLKELAIYTVENKQSDLNYFKEEARKISNRYIRGDWLETNLKTATSSAYRAAEWNRIRDPDVIDLYPAYQYKTREDERVRDEHEQLEDKVFRAIDPIWKSIWPPNGWNCRCYTIPLTADELNSGQYTIENELRNEAETKQLLKEAFPNPKDAKNFMRNPGETDSIWQKWIDEKLEGFDDSVADVIMMKVNEYSGNMRLSGLNEMFPSYKNKSIQIANELYERYLKGQNIEADLKKQDKETIELFNILKGKKAS